jgi:hypothetical protein
MISRYIIEYVESLEKFIYRISDEIKVLEEEKCPQVNEECKYQQALSQKLISAAVDPNGTNVTDHRCKEKQNNIFIIPAHVKVVAGNQQ